MARKPARLGVFADMCDLLSAIAALRKEGIEIAATYSPFRSGEIREALGESPLGPGRYYTLVGGIVGILTGIFLAVYTAAQWRFIVGGKYPIPYVPTVIPAFEFFILISVFFTLGGMLFLNRLPRLRLPAHYDKRFSQDRFGILVYCIEENKDQISNILKNSGAEEVQQVE